MSNLIRYGVPRAKEPTVLGPRLVGPLTTQQAASTGTLPRPTVVTADGPVGAPFVGYTSFNIAPVAPTGTPAKPLFVPAVEPTWARPYVFTAEPLGIAATPGLPTVVAGQQLPPQQPFTFVNHPAVAPVVVSTDTANKATVVSAVQLPQALPFVFVERTPVDPPSPPPAVPIRPTVVNAQPLPPPDVDQIILFTVVSQGLPSRATVVDAEPLPLSKPFVFVGSSKAEPPAAAPQVPIRPTVVNAQPLPPQHGQARALHGFADATPPADPQVPVKPTVVGSQSAPPQHGRSWVSHGFADALAVSQDTPPKPVIVGAQQYPPQLPTQHVGWTPFDEKIVSWPTIIGQQPYPPQAPYVSTPRGGRWGDPPPRIIQPTIVTDLSMPFRPTGWYRVAHGFADALPLLGEGSITGGIRAGLGMVGGAYSSPSAEGKAYSDGTYSDGVYEGSEGFVSQPLMTGQIQSGYMGGGRR